MNETPVCDVCGKPARVFVCHATGTVGGGRDPESWVTREEKFCEECAVAKGVEKEGFNKPKAYIPRMAEQLARILSYPGSKKLRAVMENAKMAMPPEMKGVMQSPGYKTDFSPQSLWEIDRFYDDHCGKGVVKTNAPFARGFERDLVDVGFYIGEVAVRHLGGEWVAENDEKAGAEMNFAVSLKNGVFCWPVQQAKKRFEVGLEESIAAWGLALGLPVGPRPKPPK